MTPEEITAEIEKCQKDPVYCYNTYFRRPGQPEMTKEKYNEALITLRVVSFKPRTYGPHLRDIAERQLKEEGLLL